MLKTYEAIIQNGQVSDRYTSIIDEIVEQIKTQITPLQIIVFGSIARNEAKAGSDIDLLVIMPNGTHRRKTAHKLYRTIRKIDVPLDILVATLQDLEKYQHDPSLIYHHILQEGVEVYAA
jgi:uncharacterized protein